MPVVLLDIDLFLTKIQTDGVTSRFAIVDAIYAVYLLFLGVFG
ncbi:MAG: hypothetical protein P4M11_08585 [Candidatus Pacebacteria bacterium]|nr:hypothetical protein [Candidatus Paceibacterota bacterium]